jgi:hypothetical protein
MVKSYRESVNEYKSEKAQLVEEEIHFKGKKDRNIKVEFAWLKDWSGNFKSEPDLIWHTWKHYLKVEDAKIAIKQHLCKHPGLFIFKLNDHVYQE